MHQNSAGNFAIAGLSVGGALRPADAARNGAAAALAPREFLRTGGSGALQYDAIEFGVLSVRRRLQS